MLGLPILDVAIGIAFFYLVFALVCTTVNETLSRWLKKRPKTLEEALRQLLGSDAAKNLILNHPLVKGLSRKGTKTPIPSYIPSATFATALLDQVTGANPIRDDEALRKGFDTLPPDAAAALKALYQKANGNWDQFHALVEEWYNHAMDRATGWYKRYVQMQTKVLALIIVLWVNFDTLHVTERLWSDSALRASVVDEAKSRAQARNSGELPLAVYNDASKPEKGTAVEPDESPLTPKEQQLINSVTGWQQDLKELRDNIQRHPDQKSSLWTEWFLMHLLGWTLSIFAISLGAPFWFDVLNRFMNLRNAGRAPDEPRAKNVSSKAQEVTA
jgi:hypothetical protein